MATTEEGMLERVKSGDFRDCQRLHNKAPRWNESLGAYCLNFNGRVTLPSVKNFQLQVRGRCMRFLCPELFALPSVGLGSRPG